MATRNQSLLSRAFFFWMDIADRFYKLQKDEERKPVDKSLGIASIVNTLVGIIVAIGCFVGSWIAIKAIGTFVAYIIVVVLAIIGIYALIRGMFAGMLYWIYQLRLNRQAISWAAMIVWAVSVTALIVAIALTVILIV